MEKPQRDKNFKPINRLQWLVFLVLLVLSISILYFSVKSRNIPLLILGFLLLFITLGGIRIIYEYERGIIFTFGKYSGLLNPGIVYVIPIIQSLIKVDLRVRVIDIPGQEVITKDNVSIKVNGAVFYKIFSPEKAILEVKDYERAIAIYSQTVLRDIIGGVELDDLLQNREKIAEQIRKIVDEITDKWGIDIVGVRLQDIELPTNMKRAMARQAEAEREKRAVIVKSEGELKAAENLVKASEILAKNPKAMYLRTLYTLVDISSDPNSKIIFLLPIEILEMLGLKKE